MNPIEPDRESDDSTIENPKHAPKTEGLGKKQRILIVAALGVVLLLLGFLFLSRGGKAEKHSKAVPAANRGLMQAENIRMQKDQLDGKIKRGGLDEDFEKRFQAFREANARHPNPLLDTVPDPVPMLKEDPAQDTSSSVAVRPDPSHSLYKNVTQSLPFVQKRPMTPAAQSEGEAAPAPAFKLPDKMAKAMSDEYQKAIAFNSSEQVVFTRTRTENGSKEGGTPGKPAPVKTGTAKVVISAGDELVAVLTESLNSDYPSVAKATLTSPAELAGSTLLLSYALGQERMTAQVLKLILPAKDGERAREQTLSAVVKSGLPGLAGDVSHHWIPQIAAGVVSAGLTAGALTYAAQNSNKDLGTAVLVSPLIEQSVKGVLKPVDYLGRDRPVTVTVPAGTEFRLLVTDGFEVEI
jgi:type IV secretory pathway VirB10-like protein